MELNVLKNISGYCIMPLTKIIHRFENTVTAAVLDKVKFQVMIKEQSDLSAYALKTPFVCCEFFLADNVILFLK